MKNMRKSIAVLVLLCLLLTLAGCGGGGSSDETNTASSGGGGGEVKTITLRMGHLDPEDMENPYHLTCVTFAQELEKLSNGTIKVKVYPNAQLGDDRGLTEAVQNGSVDVAAVTNAVTGNFQELTKIADLPYVFESEDQAREILSGPIGRELLDSMSEVGIKGLAFSENGMRFMLNNKRDIVTPDDLEGLKLRVMQNDLYLAFYNKTKASAVPLAFGEVYTAVTQGTIDGFDLPCPSILSYKFQEVIKHISEVRYTYTSIMTIMNQKLFDSFTAEQQGWIMDAAAAASQAAYKNNDMLLDRMFDAMNDAGVSVTRYEDMDTTAFQKIGESTWDEMITSDKGKAILNEIKKVRGIS